MFKFSLWDKKLTDDDILNIKQQFLDGLSQSDIGKQFGVSPSAIKQIVRNITYKGIGPDVKDSRPPFGVNREVVLQIYKDYLQSKNRLNIHNQSERRELLNELSSKHNIDPVVVWRIISGQTYSDVTGAEHFKVKNYKRLENIDDLINKLKSVNPEERWDMVRDYAAENRPGELVSSLTEHIRRITSEDFLPKQKKYRNLGQDETQRVFDMYRQTGNVNTTSAKLELPYSFVYNIINGKTGATDMNAPKMTPRMVSKIRQAVMESEERGVTVKSIMRLFRLLPAELEEIMSGQRPRSRFKNVDNTPINNEMINPVQPPEPTRPNPNDEVSRLYHKMISDTLGSPTERIKFNNNIGDVNDFYNNRY